MLLPSPRSNTISATSPLSGTIRLSSVTVTGLPWTSLTVPGRVAAATGEASCAFAAERCTQATNATMITVSMRAAERITNAHLFWSNPNKLAPATINDSSDPAHARRRLKNLCKSLSELPSLLVAADVRRIKLSRQACTGSERRFLGGFQPWVKSLTLRHNHDSTFPMRRGVGARAAGRYTWMLARV